MLIKNADKFEILIE